MTRWGGNQSTKARAHWAARLPLPCWRCGRPVTPDQDWHVEHMTDRADGGANGIENQWVSHATCNTSAGGRRGAQITNARRPTTTTTPRMPDEADRRIRGWP